MLSNGELRSIYFSAYGIEWGIGFKSTESEAAGLRAIAKATATRIADDMDFWNSIHDSDNQADSNWIRERYANGNQAVRTGSGG